MAVKRTTKKKVKGGGSNDASNDDGGGDSNGVIAGKTQAYPPDINEPLGPGEHSSPAVQIHNAFLVRHTGGEPTAQSYARARSQFRRIKGAVRTPATEPNRQPPERADWPSDANEDAVR